MSGFAGLDALAAQKKAAHATTPSQPASGGFAGAARGAGSEFAGLDALAAQKKAAHATTPSQPASGGFAGAARGAGSVLGTISNALDLPLAVTENVLSGKGLGRIHEDLAAGGGWKNIPGALANVSENDVYFRKGSLQRVLNDPTAGAGRKAAAQFLLNHPWVSGTADFATEFVNPGNLLTGEVLGRGAEIAGSALKAVPIVGPAVEKVSQALAATFDRYNPLKKAGGDATRMMGFQSHAAAAEAKKANDAVAMSIFGNPGKLGVGGTTRDEEDEILRRATGGAPKAVMRSSGLSDADLQARADRYREIIDQTDALQRQLGMLHQEHENYFNMRGAYERPQTARDVAMGGAPRVGASGEMRYGAPTMKEKVYHTYDEVLDAVAKGKARLKADFSPHQQLVSHLNRVSGNVALDDFIKNLATTSAAHEIAFAGKTGAEALQAARDTAMKRARIAAAARAARKIGSQFGLSPQDVQAIAQRNFADSDKLKGRLSELQRGGGLAQIKRSTEDELNTTAGRVGESIKTLANRETGQVGRAGAIGETVAPSVNRRIQQIHGNAAENADRIRTVAQRLSARVGGLQMKTLQRGVDLAQKIADPQRPIADAYRTLRDRYAIEMMSEGNPNSLWSKYRASLTPQGYIPVKNVPGLSSLDRMKYTDVKPEVVKYLTDHGAPPKDAEGLGAWIDRYNALFRIGILTNPIVHPFYNLLWAYLGGGGDVRRLATVFRDSPLDTEAARYGAHAPLSNSSIGSNQNRLVQSLPEAIHQSQGIGKVGAAADWVTSRAAEINRKIVFDTMERRMATEMWASLVAKGTDKARAGELVRKAFGDYGNITKAEQGVSRAFFFYPWTKTVIPFWAQSLATAPKWTTAPLQGILTHNELAGDPNVGKESPYTLYTGTDKEGQPQYQSLPMPQKRLEAPLEAATGNIGGAINDAKYHLTPALNIALTALEQHANQEPQEPGVTPAQNVMYDRYAPTSTKLAQVAQYAAENGVPFAPLIRGIAHGVGEAAGGAPGRALSNLAGGYQYGQGNPAQQHALNRIFDRFQQSYNRARHIPDPAARSQYQAQLYELFRRQADAILKASP
jgi:hypothetical protein